MNFKKSHYLIALVLILTQASCSFWTEKNGGLIMPDGFEAVVVVDSLPGHARHLAVNDNGDIYVKLT